MNIKKGDIVKIIAGKDKGKTGKVIHVFPPKGKLSVEGVNLYKKHLRPKKEGEKGEVVTVTRPFSSSNALLLCSACGKTTRVGFKKDGGVKVRYCKKCDARM